MWPRPPGLAATGRLSRAPRSFDASLFALCSTGRVSPAEAVKVADDPDEVLARLERMRDTGRTAEAPLRLAVEPFEDSAPPVPLMPERRSKVSPLR